MQKISVIEPMMILFDGSDKNTDITPQCESLARSYRNLIIGYTCWVTPPNFWDEFAMPKILLEDTTRRVAAARARYIAQGINPDKITIQNPSDTEPGVIFFLDKEIISWYTITEEWAMDRKFQQMTREWRRSLERKYKLSMLPIGINIRTSPKLVMEYNTLIRHFLSLKKSENK